MKILDISWPISEQMTAYKDKHTVKFDMVRTMSADNMRDSHIAMSSHTGTHVDAPSHFIEDGKTMDKIRLERLVGPCKVLSVTLADGTITADHLEPYPIAQGDIVLFKTSNSALGETEKFNAQFVYLDESAARYLGQKKVKAVGLDYLSMERSNPEHPTHLALFAHDVVIIEGLRLQHVPAGDYFFVCLPLNVVGLEAAPARAILISQFSATNG